VETIVDEMQDDDDVITEPQDGWQDFCSGWPTGFDESR